jgi:hypothetical protein
MTVMRTTIAMLALFLMVVACGEDVEPSADQEPTTSLGVTTTSEDGVTNMTETPDELPIVEPARTDLARRLGIDPDEIEVVRAEEITWPDGSMGCPEPGKSYTQALVEGSRVVLVHDDRVYVYHAGGGSEPFLCPSGEKDGGHDFVPPPGFNE